MIFKYRELLSGPLPRLPIFKSAFISKWVRHVVGCCFSSMHWILVQINAVLHGSVHTKCSVYTQSVHYNTKYYIVLPFLLGNIEELKNICKKYK